MPEFLKVLIQYIAPLKTLTRLAGKLAAWPGGRVTTWIVRLFVRRYGVDLSEAVEPSPSAYASFNHFFTRALRPRARPIASGGLVCPADGCVSELGRIEGDQIFQAKGRRYSTLALLGGDAELAERFKDGAFATIYLSPRDYHRVHMPADGRLKRMIYVPGSLFSVNPIMARRIPGLFSRNERVVCLFESDTGPFALVLVGAAIVGSVATVWHGVVTPPRSQEMRSWHYDGVDVELLRGQEMGRFQLGSTVVALFGRNDVRFTSGWQSGTKVRMGEALGTLTKP